ncbi:hypothetical protein HUA74_33565 [Myxococcus sp. CA051A]|uniref:hypothetical protein n=1 Tax=unclassified Myxococcus TaxID=2648731 RepID=UPI00157AE51C|nr:MULTISPECIES: hypothetical protein [unclassified Myxococcus]NTX08724.1 hypothetical protein [Myxococcus sp. CA040A]NTX65599.1 hypothetical protein [Myxococcus sp. CA051A]
MRNLVSGCRRSLVVALGLLLAACGDAPVESPAPPEMAPHLPSTPDGQVHAMSLQAFIVCDPPNVFTSCEGYVTGGVAPYTFYFGRNIIEYETGRQYSVTGPGTGGWYPYGCTPPSEEQPATFDEQPTLRVRDALGNYSPLVTDSYRACHAP